MNAEQLQNETLKQAVTGDAKAIVSALKHHKGQHLRVTWVRKMKTLKGIQSVITKRTSAHVRAGIDFAKLSTVQEGIAEGTRGEVQKLPWGEWSEFPFIIKHKDAEYLRLYPASFDNLKPHVEYTLDGIPTTAENIRSLCLASEFRENAEEIQCFTIKAESLISIGD